MGSDRLDKMKELVERTPDDARARYFLAHELFKHSQQLVDLDGFGQVFVGAGFERDNLIAGVAAAGTNDNLRIRECAAAGVQSAAKLESVAARH